MWGELCSFAFFFRFFAAAKNLSQIQIFSLTNGGPFRIIRKVSHGTDKNAALAHLVERHLAKVEVASSSLVSRSIWCCSQVVRQGSAKPSCDGSNPSSTSIQIADSFICDFFIPKKRYPAVFVYPDPVFSRFG